MIHKSIRKKEQAFSRADLLALLGVAAVLIMLQLPALGLSRARGHTIQCLDNLRQLTLGWILFAADANGNLPGNLDGGNSPGATNRTWCVGWLSLSFTPDNTNVAYLTDSQLGKYVNRSTRIYRCPADQSLSRGVSGVPRVRSVSMNSYMGERSGPFTTGFRQFRRLEEVTDPKPSEAFVFIDEREDSINDGWFAIAMQGSVPRNPSLYQMIDFPADWHERGANLSFADGHVESWHWRDARTMPSHRRGSFIALGQASPNNPDVARLHAAASSPVRR